MRIGPFLPGAAGIGKEVLCVRLEDGRVDVDGVWVEELWVLEWGEDWFREALLEEGVFVGSMIAAHTGVDVLCFAEDVGEEGGVVVGGGELKEAAFAGVQVHAGVVGELDSLDDVEDDGVFEADQLEADLAEIEGGAGVGHVNCGVHCGWLFDMMGGYGRRGVGSVRLLLCAGNVDVRSWGAR